MRKIITITIDAEGRDQGKVFSLREMPASQAEKWATKTFLALAKSGVEIPDNIATAGLAGLASLSIKAFAGMRFEDAEPLLDEMFQCIKIIPDPSKPNVIRDLVEDDIEEVSTRLRLRKEVLDLHTGFFTNAAR